MTNPLAGVRGRVTFAVLAVAAAVFSLLGTIGFVRIADSGREAARDRIDDVLDDLEAGLRRGTGTLEIRTADGVVATATTPDPPPEARPGELLVTRPVEVGGASVLLVGRASEAPLTDGMRSLHRGLWIAIPTAAVVCALLAGLATRRALQPVAAITALASTVGAHPDGARVPVPGTGDEIEALAATVNGMLERIDDGRAAHRRFTSDAAHELRTPLMALQGELELVGGRPEAVDAATLSRLDALAHRLGDRIDDLVLLSTMDEGRPLALVPTSVVALAAEEAAAIAPEADVSGDAVEVPLDRALAGRLVRNLVANARRHATDRVSVTVEAASDRVWLHVDDDGPGVAPEHREDLFRRFTRLDEARSTDRGGSGLGLAIVASVAAAHGGGVHAATAPTGGLRVSVWFPQVTGPR